MKASFIIQPFKHLWILFAFCITNIAFADNYIPVKPTSTSQDPVKVQEALNEIEPYGTVHLEAGNFDFGDNTVYIVKPCTLEGEEDLNGNLETTIYGANGLWIFDICSSGVTIKNLTIENLAYGHSIRISENLVGEKVIIENNILKDWWGGIYSYGCSLDEITILNNHISCQQGIMLMYIDCPINIIGNEINNVNDIYIMNGLPIGIQVTSLYENPSVNISNNIISLKDGCTFGIRVGNSKYGLSNCTVKDNIIKSFEGTTAFEGIGCYPMGENNSIINNDLSGLSTWGWQVLIAGRNNLLQGNVFGFANGDPVLAGYGSPVAVAIATIYPHCENGCDPRDAPTEDNTIMDNDYRNCGLLGWEDDENGNIVGGCILVQAVPEGDGNGPPNEVCFNYVHETGRFPEGTGAPKKQILVVKSVNADGTQLVHDNRIIGLSADELVLYKNSNKNKSTIIDQSFVHKENYSDQSDILQLYPNPSDDIINIEIENINNATIEIYNVNGRLVYKKALESKTEKIDISSLSEGMHIIKVRQENNVRIEKIIVY